MVTRAVVEALDRVVEQRLRGLARQVGHARHDLLVAAPARAGQVDASRRAAA